MPGKKDRMFSKTTPLTPEEEIVISGISGRFPNSRNLYEFANNLYTKTDMVDDLETRWRHTNVEIPTRMGKVSDLDKFDHTFFEITYQQAHAMDPQMRLLIEHAYEAVMDAGVNPRSIRGSKTGVFIGTCFAESEKTWFYERQTPHGYGLTGCCRSFLAARIGYHLGTTGPCHILDTACSSSMFALDAAFKSIRSGECDAALIGGCNLVLHPYVTLQFAKLGVIAANGYCRPFDKDASGYTRSEAVCVIYLQKIKDAKRVYNSVVYTKSNCDGYKEQGITYPAGNIQAKLLSEFYKDINIDPATVDFVEAHSTGTFVGDPEECNALDKIFCTGRTKPLPVGSVKSNIGHSEATSGACSIAKVLLTFYNSCIPPNINFNEMKPGITSLEEGRLKVVTEPTPLDGPLISLNSFGFGGANAHALMKDNLNAKVNGGAPLDSLPRLVIWSGRTEEAVHSILNDVESRSLDAEFVGLLHNIQNEAIPTNIYRGFGVYGHKQGMSAVRLQREVQPYSGLKRKFVWIFNNLGIDWIDVSKSMVNFPVFASSLEKCHSIMQSKKIDLLSIVGSGAKAIGNILQSFVGTVAIQIAFVDLLRSLKMEPDYFIGHSIGELGCAYADGCLTVEQAMLCAHAVGEVALGAKVEAGTMAFVGMGYRKIRSIVPSDIEIASHNSADSSIISGSVKSIATFTNALRKQNVFVREIPCSGIPFHSKLIASLGPLLIARLNQIIPVPARRSAKWLSTSVTSKHPNQDKFLDCSGFYLASALLNPVLLEETLGTLPRKSLTVEIAPHDVLQNCLRTAMPDAVHINLLEKGNNNNLLYFLSALGRLYNNGLDFYLAELYPAVKFPVSAKTPMISPLIKWDFSEDFFVTNYEDFTSRKSCVSTVKVALNRAGYEHIDGHTIDGRILFPATGYLFITWEIFSKMVGPFYFDLCVEFTDVKFLRATALTKSTEVELRVMVQPGSGRFEICEGTSTVVTGFIKVFDKITLLEVPIPEDTGAPMLETKDFYKELRLRGYHYNGAFRSVVRARGDGLIGQVKWDRDWISFMDCLLQIQIIGKDSRNLLLPIGIQRLRIDPSAHFFKAKELEHTNNHIFDVHMSKELNTLRCGGIEICGLLASPVGRRKAPGFPVLESYKFIPNMPAPQLHVSDAIRVCVQLALENIPTLKIRAVEIGAAEQTPIIQYFQEALGDLPVVTSELLYLSNQKPEIGNIPVEDGNISTQTNCLFLINSNALSNPEFMERAAESLSDNGFIVSREVANIDCNSIVPPIGYQVLAVLPVENESLVLLQHQKKKTAANPTVFHISMTDDQYLWLAEVHTAAKNGPIIIVSQNEPLSGVIGFVNCLRKEPDGSQVSCVFIDDQNAPPFSLESNFYKAQLKLGMAINVYRNGSWGSYRHLQLIGQYECKPRINHNYANAIVKGDLSSLTWLNGAYDVVPPTSKIVNVAYAALNFRDVMLASGKLNAEVLGTNRIDQECVLGFEFSGVTEDGQRMMGMVMSGALATKNVFDDALSWECPDKWTLEQAATIPVVYGTVYSAFFISTKISKGKSILIHAGSGGVGLAAIRVALHYGLVVYTTVSTEEKKQFLLTTFPNLNPNNIGNSRNTSFEDMIMTQTNGKGVDFVLNSLSDEKLQASVRCLGVGGVFLEIGKFDMANDSKLSLANFKEGISFRAVLVDNVLGGCREEKLNLRDMVLHDINSGVVEPLQTTVFPANEVEQAYRYLGSGKHVGKVLLKIRENDFDEHTLPITVKPKVYCHPDLSYIIPGGLGGFGLELADWLMLRGCRKLVLSSSRGITKQYQAYRIKLWENLGVTTVVNTDDITTREGCENLIREAMKLGPVGGIFNLAVALRDAIFENQDAQKFTECMGPKAIATKHLDEVSRVLCPKLHHFVVFSSVSCGRGNAGQTNYGMANSVMERIVEHRYRDGLPAKAVQWGAVGEVGLVADMQEDKLDMEIGGTLQQRISSCLQELDPLLESPDPIVASMVVAEKRIRGDGSESVVGTVMNIMSIRDIKSISMDTTLSELGMDSLMAVEIKQTLERDFEIFLTPQDLRSLTFLKLQELSDARSGGSAESAPVKMNDEMPTGLAILLRNLGEESNSGQTILRLASLNNEDNFESCVLLTPGIEGVAGETWRTVAANIALPAFILQLASTSNLSTVQEVAESILDDIKQKVFKNCKKFYLVGYSFGALVTMEIAKLLEQSGMLGQVILIDGSPPFLKQLAIDQLPENYTDETLQLFLLINMVRIIFHDDNTHIIKAIYACDTWLGRIDCLLEFAKEQNIYSNEYIRQMTHATFLRLKMAVNIDLNVIEPIISPITLVRPTEASIIDYIEDYGLSKYTTGEVNLKFIEGSHSTMLDNPKLNQIINDVRL